MYVRHFKNVHKSSDVIAECHYYVNKKKMLLPLGSFNSFHAQPPLLLRSYTFLPHEHYEFDEFIQKTFPFHLCLFAKGKLKIRLEIA